MSQDFYNILDISSNATSEEIKKAYHKCAFKYHPDKTRNNNPEQFQQINMAYSILYDSVKREQYDRLTFKQRNNISHIFNELIQKLLNTKRNYNFNEFEEVKILIFDKIYQEIINYFIPKQSDNDFNDLVSIFIPNDKCLDINKEYTSYETSLSNTHASEMNMQITIYTNIEEIYNNKVKELTILRHKFNGSKSSLKLEEKKIYIPLYNEKIVLEREGDEYLHNSIVMKGDIIIKIKCKKHKYINRINDYDILLQLPITIYDLLYGFKKKIRYLNNEIITVVVTNAYNKYKDNCIEVILNNYGLPFMSNNNLCRGKLVIEFKLDQINI